MVESCFQKLKSGIRLCIYQYFINNCRIFCLKFHKLKTDITITSGVNKYVIKKRYSKGSNSYGNHMY